MTQRPVFPLSDERKLDRLFEMFDADKSGLVDFVEFSMALEMFTSESPVQKLRFMFQCIDVDGNGRITKDELEKVIRVANIGGEDLAAVGRVAPYKV